MNYALVGSLIITFLLPMSLVPAYAQPPEFYRLLAKTQLETGRTGYNTLRTMVPRMPAAAAAAEFRAGRLILADTQPKAGYFNVHISGAVWLPWDILDSIKVNLPKGAKIALYCP